MNFPSKFLEDAVNEFAKLPGIGKKTALRLVLHLLKQEQSEVDEFGNAFIRMKKHIGDPNDQQLKFYKTRKRECAERFSLNRQRFILSIPNDEFFSVSNHIRFYVHDDFHEAVAHTPGKPLYKECKKDLSIAKIEVGLFKKLSPANQLAMVQEEFNINLSDR